MSRFNLSAWAVAHPALVLFLILMLGTAGIFSYRKLGRAEDPSFTIKVAVVTAIWPGATAAEMQDAGRRSDREEAAGAALFRQGHDLHQAVASRRCRSRSRTTRRPAKCRSSSTSCARSSATSRTTCRPDVIGPTVNDEYGDVDSILYMLTADGADYAQMKKVAEAHAPAPAQGEERHQGQSLRHSGREDLRRVQPRQARDARHHARRPSFQSLARQNAVVPAGMVETGAQRVPLRVTGALDGAKAVAETPVEADGRVFRLGDIATVTRGFEDPPNFLVRQRGKPAIGIGIVMAKGANILDLGPDVASATAALHGRRCRRASISSRSPISRQVVDHAVERVRPLLRRGAGASCCSSASSRSAGAPASWWRCRCRWCSPSSSSS